MVLNLDAFKNAKLEHDNYVGNKLNLRKDILLSLMEKMETFVSDMNDIADTFYAVKRIDKAYSQKLWEYLSGNKRIDINSHWGAACDDPRYFYTNICVNRKGLCIFYDIEEQRLDDWDALGWQGNNAKEYIQNANLDSEILDKYIYSTERFIEDFPAFRDGFFKMVEEPKFES